MGSKTRLLLDSNDLVTFQRDLAVIVGDREAIALQQIHYWCDINQRQNRKEHFIDGQWWLYNTWGEWRERDFPFWSLSTIRRVFASLESKALIITRPHEARNKGSWITINYGQLEAELKTRKSTFKVRRQKPGGSVQNEQTRSVQNEQGGLFKMSRPSVQNEQTLREHREYTETTSEIKDSSPPGESNSGTSTSKSSGTSESSAAPKPGRPRNVMFDAVSWAWNNQNGGYVAKLAKFLEGRCLPADGLYYQWQLAPPMTPVEVVGFRLWREHVERDMPTMPETMQRTIEEFRGVPEYVRVMERAEQRLTELELALERASASSDIAGTQPAIEPAESVDAGLEDGDAFTGDDVNRDVDAVFEAMAQQLGGKYDTGLG